jgi:hypothetical protein
VRIEQKERKNIKGFLPPLSHIELRGSVDDDPPERNNLLIESDYNQLTDTMSLSLSDKTVTIN